MKIQVTEFKKLKRKGANGLIGYLTISIANTILIRDIAAVGGPLLTFQYPTKKIGQHDTVINVLDFPREAQRVAFEHALRLAVQEWEKAEEARLKAAYEEVAQKTHNDAAI